MSEISNFPPGAALAEAGVARKGSAPELCPAPGSAMQVIEGRAELVEGGEADELRQAYREALLDMANGLRRVVICGGILMEIKERVGHGNFLLWLAKNAPEIPVRTAQRWMFLAAGLRDNLQDRHNGVFGDLPINRLLQLPETDVSEDQRTIRTDAMDLLQGKTQIQLMLQFKFSNAGYHPGGDNEYLAFLRERHPELIKENGRPPKRSKELSKEFTKWQLKRMNPKARAQHVLDQANRVADMTISCMKLVLMEDTLFKCSKDRLIILWDLNQKLNKILKDARGGRTDGSDVTDN